MTKAQEIHTAQQTLGTIILDVVNKAGVITPDQRKSMIAEAHWCFIALGHIRPLKRAQTFVGDITTHCLAEMNTSKNQA